MALKAFSKTAKSAPCPFVIGEAKVKIALPPSPKLTIPFMPDFPVAEVSLPTVVFPNAVFEMSCQPLSILALVAQPTKTEESL